MPATPRSTSSSVSSSSVEPPGSLGAEHRGVALPGQRLPDDLGEGREDRVVQLRGDQADQARAALPQPYRAARSRGRRARRARAGGCRGDARLAVEHPADGGLADPRLGGDVGEPGRSPGWTARPDGASSDRPPHSGVRGQFGLAAGRLQRRAGQQHPAGGRQSDRRARRVDRADEAARAAEGEHALGGVQPLTASPAPRPGCARRARAPRGTAPGWRRGRRSAPRR